MENENEYYYPDSLWSEIKSYILTFDKTRVSKTAKLLHDYIQDYNELIENDEILPETSFCFIYFYSLMKYRPHFNYALFTRRHTLAESLSSFLVR